MKQELTDKKEKQQLLFYRIAYALFLALVIYYLAKGDIENATINMGIALIFDPFNPQVKWSDRALYQRVWLLIHLAITLAGFLYIIRW